MMEGVMVDQIVLARRWQTENCADMARRLKWVIEHLETLDRGIVLLGESVDGLLKAMPVIPHPGGRLVKVVAHYEDESTQTIDGDVVIRAVEKARGE